MLLTSKPLIHFISFHLRAAALEDINPKGISQAFHLGDELLLSAEEELTVGRELGIRAGGHSMGDPCSEQPRGRTQSGTLGAPEVGFRFSKRHLVGLFVGSGQSCVCLGVCVLAKEGLFYFFQLPGLQSNSAGCKQGGGRWPREALELVCCEPVPLFLRADGIWLAVNLEGQ